MPRIPLLFAVFTVERRMSDIWKYSGRLYIPPLSSLGAPTSKRGADNASSTAGQGKEWGIALAIALDSSVV